MKRELNFICNFKCEDDIDNFNMLPDYAQIIIEKSICDVVYESFVVPADEDYVTARFLAQKGRYRAFFWAAAQAIEKYLKAFLLFNGVSVNERRFNGHPLVALFEEASSLDSELKNLSVKFHSSIRINENFKELFSEVSVSEFLRMLESEGSPDNRYNSFGTDFNSGYLFSLDSFIYALRGKVGVPPIEVFVEKLDYDLVRKFYLYNPFFSGKTILRRLPNRSFKMRASISSTTMDRFVCDNPPFYSGYIAQWLNKKMRLPKKVQEALNLERKKG